MGTYHDPISIPFSSKTKKRAEWRDTSVLRSKTLAKGEFISPEQVQLPLGRSGQRPRSPNKNPPAKPGVFHMRAKPYVTSHAPGAPQEYFLALRAQGA